MERPNADAEARRQALSRNVPACSSSDKAARARSANVAAGGAPSRSAAYRSSSDNSEGSVRRQGRSRSRREARAHSRRSQTAVEHRRSARARANRVAPDVRSAPQRDSTSCEWQRGRCAPTRQGAIRPSGGVQPYHLAGDVTRGRDPLISRAGPVRSRGSNVVATDTLECGTKCRARDHRIKVDVERAELGMFRNVQTEIVIASCPHPVREKPTHALIGTVASGSSSILLSMPRVEKRDRIVAQCHETRHQRAQGTNGQPRLATAPRAFQRIPVVESSR